MDDYASTKLSRLGLNQMWQLYPCDVDLDVLIVQALDRLARDPYYRRTIEIEAEADGARVEYVLGNYDDTPEGEVNKDLDTTFAKWENASVPSVPTEARVAKLRVVNLLLALHLMATSVTTMLWEAWQ